MTQNEPQCFIGLALLDGVHAPGDKLKYPDYLMAAHNAHARARQGGAGAARAAPRTAKVGYVLAAQIAAAGQRQAGGRRGGPPGDVLGPARHQWNNAWWTDPVLLGQVPRGRRRAVRQGRAEVQDQRPRRDEAAARLSGAQHLQGRDLPAAARTASPSRSRCAPGFPRSGVDWQPITPSALYWGPRFFYERYKLPIAITENGLSTRDQVFLDGKVHDPQRIDYMHRVLLELARAIKDGVPITGYYAWSLLDNFEWADGYKQRFGMVYVDYQSQKRVPKDSYDWYKKVIASNGRSLLDKACCR